MPRRGRGEGSVYRRPDGRWCAVLSWTEPDGRRRRRWFYGRTKREALEKLQEAQRQLLPGVALDAGGETLASFLRRWVEHRRDVRPITRENYRFVIEHDLIPRLGRVRLRDLSPADVAEYVRALVAEGYRPSTVRLRFAVLRAALADAERWGLVPRNVARLVHPPRENQPRERPLTREEAQRVLAVAPQVRDGDLVVVALATGLRSGELRGLRWEDVRWEAGELVVRRTLVDRPQPFQEQLPKGGRARTVPLPRFALAALRDRYERLGRPPGTAPVWTARGGTPLAAHAVRAIVRRVLRAAGVPPRHVHDLRDTAATLLLEAGVDLRVVQEVLGHASIDVTAERYAHVRARLLAQAATALDAFVGQAVGRDAATADRHRVATGDAGPT